MTEPVVVRLVSLQIALEIVIALRDFGPEPHTRKRPPWAAASCFECS